MDDTLKQDFKKQFELLPVEIQEAISDVDLPDKLQKIARENKLMVDQVGDLETETVLVLFGLEPLENYIKNLKKNVHLSDLQASMVAHDVNEMIFKNIRELLKKINDDVAEIENSSQQSQTNTDNGIESHPQTNTDLTQTNADKIQINKQQNKDISPTLSSLISKPIIQPFYQNISPVSNIVESKLNDTIIIPKETIVIEEKDKLPEKSDMVIDPYREVI